MTQPPGLIGGEPRDGDFVAYLEQIERQQAQALARSTGAAAARPAAAPGSVSPGAPETAPSSKDPAQALIESLKAQSSRGGLNPGDLIGALVLGFIGLVFLLIGLSSGAGIFAIAIAGVLFWQAWRRLRQLFGATGDLATRLRQQQRQQR